MVNVDIVMVTKTGGGVEIEQRRDASFYPLGENHGNAAAASAT